MSYDLINAQAYARGAPGFLKAARERGDAAAAAEQERRIAWANEVLARHGKALIPGTAASPDSSVPSRPSPAPAADYGWNSIVADVSGTAPWRTAASPWDGVVADLNRSLASPTGPEAVAPPEPTPNANHGWDAVMAQVSAEASPGKSDSTASSDPWAEAMASVNAENGAILEGLGPAPSDALPGGLDRSR